MPSDGHIRLLPLHVANKIAAGEVVERPASVVKELLENAIDASATQIDIEVTAGGRRLIAVRDNGCGMTRDDALLSIERQATSKIRDVDDIEQIDTLGFRGEAIPSIASVSRFLMRTRRHADDGGTEIVINAGTLADVRDAGMPPGTLIEVRDLFCNVPARRKFLRAYQTEQAHIKAVFTLHALAHPAIGFSLTSDNREQYRLPPGATQMERVRDLFGAAFATSLKPIDCTTGNIHITGFCARPDVMDTLRGEQFVFINTRPATAPVIAYAIKEAYPRMDSHNRPVVLLFITLPPGHVDVNVHPTKREVRFHKPAAVRDAIIRAISTALGRPIPESTTPAMAPATPPAAASTPFITPVATPQVSHPATPAISLPDFKSPPSPMPVVHTPTLPIPTPAPDVTTTEGTPWKWFRVLGQTASGYLFIETDTGVVTINPRAARERIIYERLMDQVENGRNVSQALLLPETVQLPPAAAARVLPFLPILQSMGFSIEPFGKDTFIVDALPRAVADASCSALINGIARDIEEAGTRRGSGKWRETLIAQSVARASRGKDETLTDDAARVLVETLGATRMPYVCPRGRPTMILTATRELDRKFDV